MKRLLLIGLLVGLLSAFALHARPAAALFEGAKEQACQGVSASDTPDPNNNCDQAAGSGINNLLHTAINVFSIVVGIIAVIMIMLGGLKYITSSGDSNNINSAKNTILYAIIGLVVVLLSQTIVRFVLNRSKPLPGCPPGATTLADGSPCKAP